MQANNSTKIAQNTIYLYVRMLILMLVSLYTSRVVLRILGVEDYGIYNVVGGIVVLFTFLNNAMVTSTQRYLNYEIGRNDFEATQQVFSISLNIHLLISVLILVLSETIGLYLLNNTIQYPESRRFAVQVIYQLSVFTTCVKIIRAPYNAAIIAYERMSFYAYLSILEAVLQLLIVFLLEKMQNDRLIMYGILLLVVAIVINLCYFVYCKLNFKICKYIFSRNHDLYNQLISFSGWSLLGGMANVASNQGLNIILNVFYGVTVNAAMGIASQVNAAVTSFVTSFQTAFNPQIVKSYASGDFKYFVNLILTTSKYSYLLLFIIALPIYICCPEVLQIWLTDVPDYSVSFCRIMIIFSLLDAIQGPLWFSVQATGKIKTYQILMSIMILSNLPLAYLLLKLGLPPTSVLLVKCLINFITLFVRLWYLKRLYNLPVNRFINEVLFRVVPITLIASALSYLPLPPCSLFVKVLFIFGISFIVNMILIYFIGISRQEKLVIKKKLYNFYEKCKRN